MTRERGLRGIRILVVDDERGPRLFVQRTLEHHGARVSAVATVDEALQAFEARPPQLVITDFRMPARGGETLIGAIRALPPERGGQVPAIVFSGSLPDDVMERVRARGFQAALVKPVDAVTLLDTVERVLRS